MFEKLGAQLRMWTTPRTTRIAVAFAFALSLVVFENVVFPIFGLGGKGRDYALFLYAVVIAPLFGAWVVAALLPASRGHASPVVPDGARGSAYGLLWVLAAIAVVPLISFDTLLQVEPVHYLTNIGPALHIMHGGKLLVDTYSQYGPGPVLVTLAAMDWIAPTFGAANIAVQLVNMAYLLVFLLYLFRTNGRQLAIAAIVGVITIMLFLAIWGNGRAGIHLAPSSLGMRYLIPFALCLVLVDLRPPKRHSVVTLALVFCATLWSVDALMGTLFVYAGYAFFLATRSRKVSVLFIDAAIVALAVALGVVATYGVGRVTTGEWPDLLIYLRFFAIYNPASDYWSLPSTPFLGYTVVLVSVFCLFASAWLAAARQEEHLIFYRDVPIGLFVIWSSLYYVSRSVDYTLLIALFPLVAMCLPYAIQWGGYARRAAGVAAVVAATTAVGLSLPTLVKRDGPYFTVVHECLYEGRCSPAAIADHLASQTSSKRMLELSGDPWSDGRFRDTRDILPPAVTLINRYALPEAPVTVLLGQSWKVTYLSEVALMHTGRWHTWPRSFALTDDLVPQLLSRIVNAPVALRAGSVVIRRADTLYLEGTELGIFERLAREYVLCDLGSEFPELMAFKVVGPASGAPDEPDHVASRCPSVSAEIK